MTENDRGWACNWQSSWLQVCVMQIYLYQFSFSAKEPFCNIVEVMFASCILWSVCPGTGEGLMRNWMCQSPRKLPIARGNHVSKDCVVTLPGFNRKIPLESGSIEFLTSDCWEWQQNICHHHSNSAEELQCSYKIWCRNNHILSFWLIYTMFIYVCVI